MAGAPSGSVPAALLYSVPMEYHASAPTGAIKE